ncbi:virion structural protein [Pseudomonas phage PhiPA3]|uniref:Uncharacterized protein 235 n=1 Tax=Pseudomonas phage PhiPA3 TaxID=998086 RepID=F8SJ78_BPPA3|nr:virion structural protein [Pseudomonas phage PhiPA3]AEH03658.1 hypothetical protein [Pseudomonas phage PhiPA3]
MVYAIPDKAAGKYASAQTVNWTFAAGVVGYTWNTGDTPPVISEYIAYDNQTPQNPFIAVTQDGSGKVVYDGGFPKWLNNQLGSTTTTTPFANLTIGQKYFVNALNFIASPDRPKKVLFLGDRLFTNSGGSYQIKETAPGGFKTFIETLSAVAGYIPTIKDSGDYGGSSLNPTLVEMDQYAAVVLVATDTTKVAGWFTANALLDIQTYRRNGGGIFIITDDGPEISDIANASPTPTNAFFCTANQLAVKFNCWFSGNYNRTPILVSELKANYGDHPLWQGMADTDMFPAGGSESRVYVNSVALSAPSALATPIASSALTKVNFLVKLADGSFHTETYGYTTNGSDIVQYLNRAANNVVVTALDTGVNNSAALDFNITHTTSGTLVAYIRRYKIDSQSVVNVGEVRYVPGQGTVTSWYAYNGIVPVRNGDKIYVDFIAPFEYHSELPVTRYMPPMHGIVKTLADAAKWIRPRYSTGSLISVIRRAVEEAAGQHPAMGMDQWTGTAQHVMGLANFYADLLDRPRTQAVAYSTTAAITAALPTLTPPDASAIFNKWARFSNNAYYPAGTTPEGDAASWTWDDTTKQAIQTVNSGTYNGFLSDETPMVWTLDVTLQSNNIDDDFNGIVICFDRDESAGINRTLSVVVNRGAMGFGTLPHPWPNLMLLTGFERGNPAHAEWKVFGQSSVGDPTDTSGWNGSYRRLFISRRADQITVQASDWNSTVLNNVHTLTLDLTSDPLLARFRGPKRYGLSNQSQPDSFFKNINYVGELQRNLALDMQANKVYFYTSNGWLLLNGVLIHDLYGWPRTLESSVDGSVWHLNQDRTITRIS